MKRSLAAGSHERGQTGFMRQGVTGLGQRIEAFTDDLPGRLAVGQHEVGGPGDLHGRTGGPAGVGGPDRQGGENRAERAHHPVHTAALLRRLDTGTAA